jgi:CelD/BcsL family acetyltransferase involved in cellulose biosynthesis
MRDAAQQTEPLADARTGTDGIVWIDRPEAVRALAAEWQDLAERTDAEVYLRPAWFSAWWDHFGTGRALACLVLRSGSGRLAGLLPFCIERVWAGPVPVRIARLAGTDPHCIVLRLPLESEVAPQALAAALRHLLGRAGCGAVSLSPVSERATHLPLLRALAAGMPDLALHEAPDGTHVIFDLPADFATWLAGLSKKRRGQLRRDQTALEARYGLREDAVVPDPAAFDAFVTLHDRQWQAVGRGGHFSDWQGSAAFYRDLAGRDTAQPPMQLFRLLAGDEPLATQFVLVGGSTAHWRLPARTLDPEAERHSIGKLGLVRMIAALIGQGVTRIEAGRGDYDYKRAYGGTDVAVRQIVICRAGGLDRLRLRWLLAWSAGLHLIYYRLWFIKLLPWLRPRLGLKPRPLWRVWRRTRL